MYDELETVPDSPPEPLTVESAREYVATYEESRIHNELLGEDVSEEHEGHVSSGGDRDVIELDIEPLEIELLRETDHGYYFVTSISGRAEHWCADESVGGDGRDENDRSCTSSTGRNNHTIVHFVDADDHLRIPYNWYTCTGPDEPYASSNDSDDVSESDSAAQLQVYNVTGEERSVSVTVRFVDDRRPETVYSDVIDTPPYLAILSNIAQRRGTYEVEAELETGYTETFEWVITDDTAASWTGTSIFVTPTEEVWIDTVDPAADIEIPSSSCRDRLARSGEGDE